MSLDVRVIQVQKAEATYTIESVLTQGLVKAGTKYQVAIPKALEYMLQSIQGGDTTILFVRDFLKVRETD